MKTHSEKFLQRRRFYMALPLLVLPFITMIFWALGGGQGTPAQASQIRPGLNLTLPGAHFAKEVELWDKFTLYEQAKRDSMQYEEARKNDPYYVVARLKGKSASDSLPPGMRLNTSLGTKDQYKQINEHQELINQKLQLLSEQISNPQTTPRLTGEESEVTGTTTPGSSPPARSSPEVDRLEQMMEQMSSEQHSDPEMRQLDGMLDKILDIQYPDRVRKHESSEPSPQSEFSVELAGPEDNISTVAGPDVSAQAVANGFFGLEDEAVPIQQAGNTIQAVVHDSQEVVPGSTVKLRLLSDVQINGQLVKKNQFVFGTCSVSAERLLIEITSIRDEHSLYPVSLKVFDLDGIEGIHIPGAITRDVAKQASGQSLQGMQLLSMDTSLGAQAAAAGIEATKGLLGKKAKLVKITLKAGYQVLLKDQNQKVQ
jgi:conjugative transposon TraM protein